MILTQSITLQVHSIPVKSVYFSGSIGMDPSNMAVIQGHGFEREAVLSLKHVSEVSKVIAPEIHHLANTCGCITCYVTDAKMMRSVENWFQNCNGYVSMYFFFYKKFAADVVITY